MSERNDSMEPAKVSCEVCMAEVPHDDAKSMEGSDYVLYFCGLDCYDRWADEAKEEESGE
ncbi:hypothetical protein AN478_07925 [Thiohalorhabdus denitrificans]|uniref:DUF3330 domain-containing protein n=1 Tax=Thiohalorhabdus denitrificans TaxID=381306 RepID=A0A0N8PMZ2_9GAMM|nr:DUF3330 domain-containing protein [Thiohalorhabdus denitrificans]KPV40077.1 hypothetical protein AN478_07925 [Thiohalorhabdus denitrificans]SCY14758.1 protein of unknown function [Thiohalorhabdus denitrificans]